jgi:hypothetical protein
LLLCALVPTVDMLTQSRYKAGQKEVQILNRLRQSDPDDKKHVVRLERTFEHRGHLCLVFESLRSLLTPVSSSMMTANARLQYEPARRRKTFWQRCRIEHSRCPRLRTAAVSCVESSAKV